MIKTLLSFFVVIVSFGNAYGGINGDGDPRVVIGWLGERPDYVPRSTKNVWDTSPYRSIVKVELEDHYGTGEFISPKHVLTNVHVAEYCGLKGNEKEYDECLIYTSDDDLHWARVAFSGMYKIKPDGTVNEDIIYGGRDKDWAVLEITDDYCHPEYRGFQEAGTIEHNLWRAGFGSLRVLEKSDIDAMRKAYLIYLDAGGVDNEETGGMTINTDAEKYAIFRDAFAQLTGKDFDTDYDSDVNTLKLVTGCRFRDINDEVPHQAGLSHSCSSWAGDSGSTIKLMSGNEVVGLNSSGYRNITSYQEYTGSDTALRVHMFLRRSEIQAAIEKAKQDCAKRKK